MERLVVEKLRELERAIVTCILDVKHAKDALKDANAALDDAYESLRAYARELSDPEKTPLFDKVNPVTGEITTIGRTAATEESR